MKIAIKNPAPVGPNLTFWGDYHFGQSLQKAFEALGHQVVQHYWPEWKTEDDEDVILVLRGKHRYSPPRGKRAFLWVISHPASLTTREIEDYDHVFVASETHQRLLVGTTRTPVETLRQCTDTALFRQEPASGNEPEREDLIFVANSRGVLRPVTQWAEEVGLPLKIYGRHWKTRPMKDWVCAEYVANQDLPALYRKARLSLNDHWSDMAWFGYINNRIFDCLACGLPVLSDDFPELRQVCGDGILYASGPDSYRAALRFSRLYDPALRKKTGALWEKLSADFTFDSRARTLTEKMEAALARLPVKARVRREVKKNEPLEKVFSTAMASLKKGGLKKDPSVLHLFPTAEGTAWFSGLPAIKLTSAGYGIGPWEIALDQEARALHEKRFDLILIESPLAMATLPSSIQGRLAQALAEKLVSGGIVVIPGPSAAPLWEDAGKVKLTLLPLPDGGQFWRR